MFGFLKKKLKEAISKFSRKVEETAKESPAPEEEAEAQPGKEEPKKREKKPAEKPKPSKARQEKPKRAPKPKEEKAAVKEKPAAEEKAPEPEAEPVAAERIPEAKAEEKAPEPEAKAEEKPALAKKEAEAAEAKPGKKGFFSRIKEKFVTTKISESQFEDIFYELEIAMLENNVAVEVIEKIKHDMESALVGNPIPRLRVEETVRNTLRKSIEGLFSVESFNLLQKIREKREKPYVICFVGINGSGKTTTIAKVARLLLDSGITPVISASDTFRAAAIDQLQLHADKLGIKLIKHDYGSDAAAVAFDAISHAKSKSRDVVLIDTAGRMHSNVNLMDEMKKIIRVAKPDIILFIGESITGNDCVEQAKSFNEAVGIDGIILSKADVDEKGGAAISISYVTGKPIIYIGTGQEYSDLKEFDPKSIISMIGI